MSDDDLRVTWMEKLTLVGALRLLIVELKALRALGEELVDLRRMQQNLLPKYGLRRELETQDADDPGHFGSLDADADLYARITDFAYAQGLGRELEELGPIALARRRGWVDDRELPLVRELMRQD